MRIVFVAPRSWPSVGGTQRLLRNVAGELAETHDVEVLALSIGDEPAGRLWDSLGAPAPFEPFLDGRIRVTPLAMPRARLAPLALQVVPGLRRFAYGRMRVALGSIYAHAVAPSIADAARNADALFVWSSGFLAAAGVRAAEKLGVPSLVLASVHGGEWGDDPTSAAAYRRASRVLAQLETEADVYAGLDVPRERIAVTGACTPSIETAGATAIRERHGIEGPLIVFVGLRRPVKGHDVLLAAAPSVSASVPNATFAFVGPGDPIAGVQGTRIVDAGVVDDAERDAWIAAADVVCLPSASESFGLVVIEAWSARVPVITSDIPTLRELVTDGAGLTVPREPAALAEALIRVLQDDDLRSRLADGGHRRWSERFTPQAVAAAIEAVTAEALAERRESVTRASRPRAQAVREPR
jgi:glycosyltransferase involved in cell wall biosynthesis